MKILSINPGSTSTKIALFEDEKPLFEKSLKHKVEELSKFVKICDQYLFRENLIIKTLEENNVSLEEIDCFVGRGGLLKPIESGTYLVNEKMIEDLENAKLEHASNLGGLLAHNLALKNNKKSFIVDPVVVDELSSVARITGNKLFEKVSIFHALNQKAVSRKYALENNKNYDELNLIVVHLGGGISIGAHKQGRVVDVNNALDGDGPFSPERSGSLPVGAFYKYVIENKLTKAEVNKLIIGEGGVVSYLKTSDMQDIIKRGLNGDVEAKSIYEAMAYQVSKEIGSMSVVLDGNVDQIIITGGIAYNKEFIEYIINKVKFISNLTIYPGEDEMSALALGGLRAMLDENEIKKYK